jgi:hypothetical protein
MTSARGVEESVDRGEQLSEAGDGLGGTVLGLSRGYLVYAKGNEIPARHVVRQVNTENICHAIDLNQPPNQLISQMEAPADVVATT